MNSAASSPSRSTAKNAAATMAHFTRPVRSIASSRTSCSSPLMARACLRIQKIIQVSTATAKIEIAANARSRASPSSDSIDRWMATPAATESAAAAATPPHIGRDQVMARGLAQVGVEDRHDQGGLEALAEHDEEGGQHRSPRCAGSGGHRGLLLVGRAGARAGADEPEPLPDPLPVPDPSSLQAATDSVSAAAISAAAARRVVRVGRVVARDIGLPLWSGQARVRAGRSPAGRTGRVVGVV